MIYYMHGKTFVKDYCTNEKPSRVLDAQYVIVSNTIMTSGNKNIVNGSAVLMPSQSYVLDYSDKEYKSNQEYKNAYFKQLELNALPILASIVVTALDDLDRDIIILCGYNEWGFRHLHMFSKWMKEMVGMPSYNYKKLKEKKGKVAELKKDDIKKIKKKVEGLVEEYQDDTISSIMKNKGRRKKFFKSFKKKELASLLKKMGFKNTKDLSKSEMIEIYEAFAKED